MTTVYQVDMPGRTTQAVSGKKAEARVGAVVELFLQQGVERVEIQRGCNPKGGLSTRLLELARRRNEAEDIEELFNLLADVEAEITGEPVERV